MRGRLQASWCGDRGEGDPSLLLGTIASLHAAVLFF